MVLLDWADCGFASLRCDRSHGTPLRPSACIAIHVAVFLLLVEKLEMFRTNVDQREPGRHAGFKPAGVFDAVRHGVPRSRPITIAKALALEALAGN